MKANVTANAVFPPQKSVSNVNFEYALMQLVLRNTNTFQ